MPGHPKKLNWEKVAEIRNSNLTNIELAENFNVSVGLISNVRTYRKWRELNFKQKIKGRR